MWWCWLFFFSLLRRAQATAMASTATFLAPNSTFSTAWGAAGGRRNRARKPCSTTVHAMSQPAQQLEQEQESVPGRGQQQQPATAAAAASTAAQARQLPPQPTAKSKNMSREYGGQWLSSCTRHVRIYAAYIDPVTHAFDQSQMDKLTLILDPTNEFVWTKETCQMVYSQFQELVDHYEGAPLTEYTLRLIGSDLEHYIRKLLYDGEIKYNMNARVLNFSMGKPRVVFNNNNNNGQPLQI